MPASAPSELDALDALNPETHPALDGPAWRRIIAARKAIEEAEAELREAVRQARDAGYSWAVVGAALDTTRQAAYQRFGASTDKPQTRSEKVVKATAEAMKTAAVGKKTGAVRGRKKAGTAKKAAATKKAAARRHSR
jgi:hypothetical protein